MGTRAADVDADAAAATSRGAGELGQIGVNGLRPAAVAVALLFAFFAIHNAVTYGAWVRATLVAYDVALVAAGGALFAALGRASWSLAAVHRTAALLSFAVLGNILVAALFGVSEEFTLYVVILIVASAGSVLSTSWAITIALVEVIAWSLAAASVLPADRVEPNALVVLSSLAAAGIVHAGRVRARGRIMELRAATRCARSRCNARSTKRTRPVASSTARSSSARPRCAASSSNACASRSSCVTRRSLTRSGASRAASRTTSTTCSP